MKKLNRILFVIIMFVLLFCIYSISSALTWELQGFSFDDGGSAKGNIDYDESTGTMKDWNIMVSGGNQSVFPDFVYSKSNSEFLLASFHPMGDSSIETKFFLFRHPWIICPNLTDPIFCNKTPRREIRFTLRGPLTESEVTVALMIDKPPDWRYPPLNEECYDCSPFRKIISGKLSRDTNSNKRKKLPGSVLLLLLD